MKHKHTPKQNGRHIAKMVPYEVTVFGNILTFTSFVGFLQAAVGALVLVVAIIFTFISQWAL